MTVSYQYEVASSTSGGFTRLLFMWRGSLYKLIYRELLLFLGGFLILSALYRNVFTDSQKRLFEKVVVYCDTFINLIPLSFVLGFYVSYVAGRWWQQYTAIPWPDKLMHCIALYVDGNDDHGRILRRTLMRYLNLSLILVLRSISSAVKRRLPTLEHVVESGFMTTTELEMYQSVPSLEFNTYWIPCTWFIGLLKNAKKNSRITDDQGLKIIMEEFNEFRSKCGMLWSYDWISIPLVYTQVVTLATYCFFLAALVGRQYVEVSKKPYQMEIDVYIPVFTILQFFFFMGLLKVAEQLINPFGDDDEDFELNWLIDRHTKVSYLGVDTLMMRYPPLVKDKYFDQDNLVLPYTEASVPYKKKTYRGSVHNMSVPEEKQGMFLPEIAEEDEERVSRSDSTVNLQEGISCSRPNSSKFKSQLDFTAPIGSLTTLHSPEEGNQDNKTIVSDSHRDLSELRYKTLLTRSESSASRKAQSPSWPSTSTLDMNLNISQLSIPSPSLTAKSSFKPFSEDISPRKYKGSKLNRMKGVWPVTLRKAKPVVWHPMSRPSMPQRTSSNVSTNIKSKISKDAIDITKVKLLRLTQSAPSLIKSRKKLSSDSFFNRLRKFKKKHPSLKKPDKISSDSFSLRRSYSLPIIFLKSYFLDQINIEDITKTKTEEKNNSDSKVSETIDIISVKAIEENKSLSQQLDPNAKATNDKVNETNDKEKDKHPIDSSLSSLNKNIDSQNEKVLDGGQPTCEQSQNTESYSLNETLIEKLSCKDSKEDITEEYSSIQDLRDNYKRSDSNLHKLTLESSKEDIKGSKMSLPDSTKEKLNESWESADWTKLLDTDNIRGDELRDMPSVLVHYSECPAVEDDGELKEVLVHKDTLKKT